jgi:hypothetical protein
MMSKGGLGGNLLHVFCWWEDLYLCTYTSRSLPTSSFESEFMRGLCGRSLGMEASVWGFTCWALGCSIPLGFPFFGLGLVEWGDFVTFFVWHVPMHFYIYIYHSCSRFTGRRTLALVNYLYSMAIIDWTSTRSYGCFHQSCIVARASTIKECEASHSEFQ